ncbi:hypothetical protein E2562_003214 [Oryza meyeriana var. granulata]|uniref:NB-ARC domain-containing protein n=1 Tax=Oryza meyeriana var. granulata TaxID=110450 RepID=A0A6G1EUT8_9ORYZ|nr:hypothetical protein E2562_003214 [Oryza meyeriana var. granulata]
MKRVLVHHYSSLPGYVIKACLLYLGIFPNGRPVRRKTLIRRWSAEGFVGADHHRSSLDVAVDNFEELVNRSIIQPVDVSSNTEVKTCQTDGMMLEFILHKSICDNFITLLYKLLRVLDLEECDDLEDEHLKKICKLLLLKYLSLGRGITVLPKEIGKLKFLETLDLRRTMVKFLPIQVLELPCLIHLFGLFKLQDVDQQMKKLKCFLSEKTRLETLAGFVTDRIIELIGLGCLKEVALDDGVGEATKEQWKDAAHRHPKHPKVVFVRTGDVDRRRMGVAGGPPPPAEDGSVAAASVAAAADVKRRAREESEISVALASLPAKMARLLGAANTHQASGTQGELSCGGNGA